MEHGKDEGECDEPREYPLQFVQAGEDSTIAF